jgi:DNA polymerase-1
MTDKIQKFFNILNNTKTPAYDVETGGATKEAPLDWKKSYVCGYSVSDGKEAVYVPVRHAMDNGGVGNITNVDGFERELARCIYNHPGKIVGHNVKFDYHAGQNHGILLGNKVKDTMVREALINENRMSYSLANVAKNYPIVQKKGKELYEHIASIVGCRPDGSSMAYFHRLSGDDLLANDYAATDTLTTKQLYEHQEKEIYGQQLEVVEGMESELTYVLQKMERKGVRVDLPEADKMKEVIADMHLEAYKQLPLKSDTLEPINVKSIKDLKEYFEWCDIDDWPMTEPTERYPDGQPSFNKDYLGTHDEGLYILQARKYDHLIDSFITPLDTHIHNGYIHTTFNQARGEFGGAKPGRLSSVNPNMQQVPKRDKQLGKIFRKIFIPDSDFILVEFDHSQAEPRLYAHYSNEKILIDGYNQTPFVDMHSITAQMMNISRDDAKHLNLGIMYTMGYPKLATKLKCSQEVAKDILNRWRRTFPGVSGFTRRASQVAEGRGHVRTILGRRARFPDTRWAYRAANRIIQGSSADILKWKMVQINRWIEQNKYQSHVQMLLNIHDAIVFQIHKEFERLIPEIAVMFASVQEQPFNLKVPFFADYHQGKDWAQASYGAH